MKVLRVPKFLETTEKPTQPHTYRPALTDKESISEGRARGQSEEPRTMIEESLPAS